MIEQKRKCLIVEDEELWRDILGEFPPQFGCEVCDVGSIEEARSEIERQYFSVALVDRQLSRDSTDADGLTVLKWLRDLQEGTQAILITQNPSMELGFDVASRYSGLGVASKKDFDEPRFLKLFDTALRTAESERQRQRESSRNGEAEILRGNRPIYLWEPEVASAVGGDVQLIHTVLSLLLEPLVPIMPPKSESPSVIKAEQHLVQCHFWSRALGRAVNLVFGRKSEVNRLRASLPRDAQIVSERDRSELAGFAQLDLAPEFNNFKSPLAAVADRDPNASLGIKGRG